MRFVLLSALLIIVLTPVGCAVTGSASIRNGRAVYNDAIVETNNEQLLNMIVRMRYQEPSGLLAVASITANVRMQGNIGAQFGVGPESSFTGNLVPLSAGALYEENPTISYRPIQGQEFMRQMLSPVPLDLTVLLFSALGDSPAAITLLIREINGIRNPEFAGDSVSDDDRFERIAGLLASLHRRGFLVWAQESGDATKFVLLLRGEGDAYVEEVSRLHDLLGLDQPANFDELITVRMLIGIGNPTGDVIRLRTRSVYDLFRIAAASVDVPADHIESGLAPHQQLGELVGDQIRIQRSSSRPKDALVAVEHHGWWYRIDASDSQSKVTFQILEALVTARLADTVDGHAATPILTVPVSR